MIRLLCFLVLAGSLFLGGCSTRSPKAPDIYPVLGKVYLPNGQPARGALVLFYPEGPGGSEASVELNADGSFILKTFGDREGAVPGRYRVALNPNRASSCSEAERNEGLRSIPNRYWNEETTDLVVEVKPEPNTITITLR